MWTLTYTEDDGTKQAAEFTGTGIYTTSAVLETLIEDFLPETPYVQATSVGPTAETDLSVGYLAYAFVGLLLRTYLNVTTNWEIEGQGYEWPEENTPTDATFSTNLFADDETLQGIKNRKANSYLQELRDKAITDFANACHDPKTGKFCDKEGHPKPTHLDNQIKDLENMINEYKDEPGGEKVVSSLTKNLEALKKKRSSGAAPYHGVDLYNTPEADIAPIKQAVDLIQNVHPIDETIPPVRVSHDPNLKGGVLGAYMPAFNRIGMQDVKDTFSMVHEMGHWQTLAPNTEGAPHNDNITEHFLSNVNKLDLGNVYYHITQSQAIKSIDAKAKTGGYNDQKAYAEYLNLPHERYARAYAQYIALRSNNPRLKDQMERFRSNNRVNNVQWTDADFEPIAKAFDEHFASKKTVRASGNPCHGPDGKFCETPGAPGHEDHRGAPSDDKVWQAALDHKDTLNASQKAAIKWYGWAGSEYVNNHLRGTQTPSKNNPQKNEKTIQQLDKALESSPNLAGATLYRGIHGNSRFATEQLANAKEGDIFADDGYVSTTTDIKHSRFFTNRAERVSIRPILVIKTKQNTKGLAVNEKEQEIILKRGTGLRVTGPSTKTEDGYTLIQVEVIT